MKSSSTKASSSSKQVEESIKLLGQATKAIGPVQRLTPLQRIRSAKIRRGVHQVVPLIATVATKYGVSSANMTGDALSASLDRAQLLQSLLSASAETHATLSDAHFNASGEVWASARTLYGMLRKVSETNPSVATELQPVEEWFRRRKPAAEQAAAAPATPLAPAAATASTTPVPATTSAPSAPVTTSATLAPVVATTSVHAPAAVVAPAAATPVTSTVATAAAPVTPPATS